jgi:hypothetical protein
MKQIYELEVDEIHCSQKLGLIQDSFEFALFDNPTGLENHRSLVHSKVQ